MQNLGDLDQHSKMTEQIIVKKIVCPEKRYSNDQDTVNEQQNIAFHASVVAGLADAVINRDEREQTG